MRLLFAGSPQLALPVLDSLHSAQKVVAVLTNPDRPSGRRGQPRPTPVKARALELALPVLQPAELDSAFFASVRALRCDLLVVAAFGKIFPREFLDLFPLGGINLHPSLLPRHRGPSPIPAAILAGDGETGVTIQRLAAKMDSGEVLKAVKVPLAGQETTGVLSQELGRLGAQLLVEAVADLEAGKIHGVPQDERQATYCRLVRKEDGRIDWSREAVLIERMIRAYDPWPGAYTRFRGRLLHLLAGGVYPEEIPAQPVQPGLVLAADKRYGILVCTGQGILYISRLQLQAKKATDWQSFLNGQRGFLGSTLGKEDD